MSSSRDASRNSECSIEVNVEENKLLWNHATKLRKSTEGGGNIAFKYNYYDITYKGSYSRVKAHLLKINGHGIRVCSKVSARQINEI